MRVMVTGAAGFIGTHLANALAEAGNHVVGFDLAKSVDATPGASSIEYVVGDIRDNNAVASAMKGVDVVFHQAAIASVPASFDDPATCMSVNTVGSTVVMEEARRAGVQRVIMASTSAVYGDDPTPLKHEGLAPRPQSPYAVSKLSMEHIANVFAHQYDMSMIALRYFNVYGPGQPATGGYAALVPAVFAALRAGEPVTIYGTGENTRGYVHVSDVVKANIAASVVALDANNPFEILNIASSEVTSVSDVVHAVANALGVAPNAVHVPPRAGDILHSRADISRSEKVLGFAPTVAFADGIRGMARMQVQSV